MKTNIYSASRLLKTAALFLGLNAFSAAHAQTITETFESFTLTANSAYSNTLSVPFSNSQASFEHYWDNTFDFWSGGFVYTNIKDSITGTFSNLYGVRAYKGYNNSDIYVVGQDEAIVRLAQAQTTVNGFYITNTTYAYKSMAKGDAFSRKFGDTTGTGSGTTIPQGSYPDFFKLIVKGYLNGVLKNDSITVMLADYTFTNNAQDYILNSWQFVNTSSMGAVDSIQFVMRSSDVGDFGINTPLFFAIDNFETSAPVTTGITEKQAAPSLNLFPNPTSGRLNLRTTTRDAKLLIVDLSGRPVYEAVISGNTELNLETLPAGMYFVKLQEGNNTTTTRILKH